MVADLHVKIYAPLFNAARKGLVTNQHSAKLGHQTRLPVGFC
jgi:hypothetical protein